ncbi:MAG TPA: radical SAM protein [Candidatus Rubrimentiphilum sp.]|nr:radical SAM protein [Candidatus Rubrimentiphilum sp.]
MAQPEAVPYSDAPRIVIWEMTRACALACRHCRAEAIPFRNPSELTTAEAFALVDSIAQERPLFILTGGDPLMRGDVFKIVEYATNKGLRVAVSPSATGRLTASALARLSRAGCKAISLSLDGPDANMHDTFRGVRGSFQRTLAAALNAHQVGLHVQINTTVSRYNIDRLYAISALIEPLDITTWTLFFLVPVGRALVQDVLNAAETEEAFRRLAEIARSVPFAVKTTEAPHYRRFLVQHHLGASPGAPGIGDGKGFVFVSHTGEVYPSGFLPYSAGNVRETPLLKLYRHDPVFQKLRRPHLFTGKCGVCEFADLCGGSRARAYAMTGSMFESDPTCAYVPEILRTPAYA